MEKFVFFSNYHISVNNTFVDDLLSCGYTVVMPDSSWGKIWFFASNEEHHSKPNVILVSYEHFLTMPSMLIVIPCTQMIDDLSNLIKERGNKDIPIYLTAQSNSVDSFPIDGSDFIVSHDLTYHRETKADYKMLYFSRPTLVVNADKDIKACFESKKINLYTNDFYTDGFDLERPEAERFSNLWMEKTGNRVPFYGFGNPDGQLSMTEVQQNMKESMFTLVFKRRETWGQMVNESMLLYTPCIFLNRYINSTFTLYLITKDTSVMAGEVQTLIDQISNMNFEQYETLCMQAKTMSELYCSDAPRRDQLKWLLNKAFERLWNTEN